MLIVEVFKKTYQRNITKKDGTNFKINYQEAEIRRQGKRPKPIEITVPRSGAYIEGLYTLTGGTFRPDDYDRLSLSPYIQLAPLDEAIVAAQSAKKEWTESAKLRK